MKRRMVPFCAPLTQRREHCIICETKQNLIQMSLLVAVLLQAFTSEVQK
jgi:hypothetical protein